MAYTTDEFAAAFQSMGYNCYFRIYSSDFECTDKLDKGLQTINKKFEDRTTPISLSITYYGVWQQELEPCVRCYLQCDLHERTLLPRSLILRYKERNFELLSEKVMCNSIEDVPDKAFLTERLNEVLNGNIKQSFRSRQTPAKPKRRKL